MMSVKVVALLRQRRDELIKLETQESNWDKIIEWYARTRPLVARYYPEELDRFDELIKPKWAESRLVGLSMPMSGPLQDAVIRMAERELQANDNIARGAKGKLIAHLDAILDLAGLDDTSPEATSQPATQGIALNQSTSVFVVHGHDEEMKQHVARTLSKLGLNPIILHEQPNSGKTIIEKFEINADVSFAVVLLSPDDMAFPASEDAKRARPRARQNVVLELGYFVGKLDRSRVFSLKRGDNLELPSDLSGVIYTAYDSAGQWRFELVRELKTAGYTVDANSLL